MLACTRRVVRSVSRLARWQSTSAAAESEFEPSSEQPEEKSNIVLTPSGPIVNGLTEREIASQIIHGRAAMDPYYHPRTHGIPVAIIHLRSYFVSQLNLFSKFATHAASALAIPISKPTPLPTQRSLWTVPKGPFVHKKSQENFDRKTHKRVIKAWDAHPEVVELWVRYMEKHALAGVGMRVVRWERAPVGVGSKILQAAQSDFEKLEGINSKDKVKILGEKIVRQELASAQELPEIERPATKQ